MEKSAERCCCFGFVAAGDNRRHGVGHSCEALQGAGYNPSNYHTWHEVYEDVLQLTYVSGGVARKIAECMSKLGSRSFMVSVVGTDIADVLQVTYVSEGVARNIAECMSKLGSRFFMVSVVGTDRAGEILLKYSKSTGLSTKGILKIYGGTTHIVANTFDSRGELAAGVASVEAVEKFVSPDYRQQFRNAIHSAPVLMIDAYLHPQSLEVASKVAAESGVSVWFEPVSVVKSTRIKSIAKYSLPLTKMSLISWGRISHYATETCYDEEKSVDSIFNMLEPDINLLLEKGIKSLVVTIGPDGALICFREGVNFVKHPLKNNRSSSSQGQQYELVDKSHRPEWYTSYLKSGMRYSHSYAFHLPALPSSVVSLTGAADCLVGGILASICNDLDVMQSVAMGIAVAKVTVESETNVPALFSLRSVAGMDPNACRLKIC